MEFTLRVLQLNQIKCNKFIPYRALHTCIISQGYDIPYAMPHTVKHTSKKTNDYSSKIMERANQIDDIRKRKEEEVKNY